MTRNAGKVPALLLAACLAAGCAAPSPQANAPAQTGLPAESKTAAAAAGASEDKSKLPLPVIFDVPLDASPKRMEHRLTELGYQRQDWTLEAPYSRLSFTLADEAATFRQVDMLVCNHPFKIAGLSIRGQDPDHFYEAVKQRFTLGIAEWEKDDRADVRHGRYARDFAGNTRAVLDSDRHGAVLSLEARDVINECQSALAKDVTDLRQAEQADIDAARKRQRESF